MDKPSHLYLVLFLVKVNQFEQYRTRKMDEKQFAQYHSNYVNFRYYFKRLTLRDNQMRII